MLLNVSLPRLRLVAFLLFTFLGQVLLGSTFEVSETPIDLRSASHRVAFSLGDDHIWTAAVVQVLDPVTGAGTGIETYIYRTIDEGSSWERFSVGHDEIPFGLHFFNSNEGILYSENTFSRTSDGGQTWTHQNLPKGSDQWPSFMFVLDEAHIWVFASVYFAYRTEDGGNTWTEVAALSGMNSVSFVDENTGFATAGLGAAFKTKDGGETWTLIEFPDHFSVSGLYFLNEDVGFASVGLSFTETTFYRTINGGKTWLEYPLPEEVTGRIHFVSSTVGFVFGEKIYRTGNGGLTWNVVYENEKGLDLGLGGTSGIQFSTTTKGAIANYGEWILITRNGGLTWVEEYIGISNNLSQGTHRFDFYSEQEGFGVFGAIYDADGVSLYYTENGGQSWVPVDLPNQNGIDVNDVFIADDGTGWAVGGLGKMWKKESASQSWISQNVDVDYGLFRIQFEDSLNGWTAGAGNMLRTKDGGESWTEIDVGTDAYLNSAYFSNGDLKWVNGGGLLFRTDDDGESWVESGGDLAMGLSFWVFDLYRVNEYGANIRVSGINEQTLEAETRWYRIENSESDWKAVSENDAVPFGTIRQIDDCNALLFGETLQVTYNGGATWTTIDGFSDLNFLDFAGDYLVYVFGFLNGSFRKIQFAYSETLVGTFSTSVEAVFPMTIDFSTEVGSKYVIEYSNDLANWNRLCESRFTATETTKSWTENNWEIEDPTNASRFYRVWKFDEQ